ncbi:MAG: YggS family pyridoxal phosphate-dependent enzyme [Chloroflexota bacterium]
MLDSALERNIRQVQSRIDAAARRSGRSPASITLVAVTKTVSPEQVDAASRLGIRDFGENRVQEARDKLAALAQGAPHSPVRERALAGPGHGNIRWHMVGHLQSNKARLATELFDVIQSVDSLGLAELLSRLALNSGKVVPVLLQVNLSQEASKYGFSVPELWGVFENIVGLPALDVRGLMTIAPLAATPEQVRPVFAATRELRDELQRRFPGASLPELSMGMTNDFEVAIEEGATMVRIGRAIFGERPR